MEIHAHHSHESGKKFTHYLWEFIMLFLAVFAGFLAENVREHLIEHKRESQYIHSLINDLKTDTANLDELLQRTDARLNNYDSLRDLLKRNDPGQNTKLLYYYFLPTTYYDLFIPTKSTIEQLESSGGLRLIENKNAVDSITEYYHQVDATLSQGNTWLRYFDQYHEIAFRIFDYSQIDTMFYDRERILLSPLNYSLLAQDKTEMKVLYNKLFALRFILRSYQGFVQKLLEKAKTTLEFLKKQYRVDL